MTNDVDRSLDEKETMIARLEPFTCEQVNQVIVSKKKEREKKRRNQQKKTSAIKITKDVDEDEEEVSSFCCMQCKPARPLSM